MESTSMGIHDVTGVKVGPAERLESEEYGSLGWTRKVFITTAGSEHQITAFGAAEEDVALTVEE